MMHSLVALSGQMKDCRATNGLIIRFGADVSIHSIYDIREIHTNTHDYSTDCISVHINSNK